MWASEIYDFEKDTFASNSNKPNEPLKSDSSRLDKLTKRHWNFDNKSDGLIKWLSDEPYQLALFRVWCLLAEVLDLRDICEAIKSGNSRRREPNPNAVAVRHWYKSACSISQSLAATDPLIPVRLPGHFTARGDWFLAVAGGSRSGRLADRALDLLSSRRANHARLEQGLGLPTRNIEETGAHTGLYTLDKGEMKQDGREEKERGRRILYQDLLKIGANNKRYDFSLALAQWAKSVLSSYKYLA